MTWLIQYESGAYRFGRPGKDTQMVTCPAADELDTDPLITALTEAGYSGEPVMLAIPSEWCLSASAVLASRRSTRNREAVVYALEEDLPLSAEDMVCDFVVNDTSVFGVAANSADLLSVVRSLRDAGIVVATITPTAMIMLQRLSRMRRWPSEGLVLLANDDQCDVFVVRGGKPQQWRCIQNKTDLQRREIATHLLTCSDDTTHLEVLAVGVEHDNCESLRKLDPAIEISSERLERDDTLLGEAGNVLHSGRRPWIELRRDQIGQYDPYRLMRGAIYALLTALLVAVTSLSFTAWAHGNRYHAVVESVEREKRDLFSELFPDARVPSGISSRLDSERRKLTGTSGGQDNIPELKSVTPLFVDALGALPTDLRFRLLELEFEEDNAFLEGEVRRHGDVDVIATALRSSGFEVDPPGTEQLSDKGVGFTLSVSTGSSDDSQN